MWSYKKDGRSWGIRIHTECPVRHTKCGRMRGMVVGEGGRSSGVLLYCHKCLLLLIYWMHFCIMFCNMQSVMKLKTTAYSRHCIKNTDNFATTKLVLLPGLEPGSKSLLPPKIWMSRPAINDLLTNRDKRTQIDMAILDFSKAFDTVPHQRLLGKLSFYGIKGPLLNRIGAF